MPIYEYECRKCGQTIEVIQKMSDPDLKKHAGCGGSLTKLLSVPLRQIKGAVSQSDAYLNKTQSYQQQVENETKRKEKQRRVSPVVSAPPAKKASRRK